MAKWYIVHGYTGTTEPTQSADEAWLKFRCVVKRSKRRWQIECKQQVTGILIEATTKRAAKESNMKHQSGTIGRGTWSVICRKQIWV